MKKGKLLFFLCFFFFSSSLFAQTEDAAVNVEVLHKMALLAGLSILPFAIMLLTSFLKMIVVLSLLRNALGVQQTPPNQVLNGIALLLTIYVMFPVGIQMYDASKEEINTNPPKELTSDQTATYVIRIIDKAKEPLRGFLQRNAFG
ncbi:MAG: hypothetical protein WCP39_07770, partial [Chlamydiota bacterium]